MSIKNFIKIDIIILILFSKRNGKKNIKNKKNFIYYAYNKKGHIAKNYHFYNKIKREEFKIIIIKNILNKISEKNVV